MIIFSGALFAIIFTIFMGFLCGGAVWFVDTVSLVSIILPLVFFSVITKSGKAINTYIKCSFKKDYEYSALELKMIAMSAKNTVKFCNGMGVFGFLIGFIAALAMLSEPHQIGPTIAISLLTLFYAIGISYFIFFPLQIWAENKLILIDIRACGPSALQ